MARLREGAAGVLICFAFALPLWAANAANDFYVGLLHRGIAHADAGQYETADKELRIAAFGLVDSIADFETAEVYLAITGDKLHSEADSRRALQRVIAADRVERRYGSLSLPANVRTQFDQIASKLLTSDQYAFLKGSPSGPPAAPAMTPQHSSAPAPVPPPAASNPKPPPVVAPPPKPVPQQSRQQSHPQPSPQPQPQPPAPVPVPTFDVSTQMAAADKSLDRNDLAGARKIYDQIVLQPGLDHATLIHLGEQSYRARDFATAARAFARSGFNSSEAPYRYYYAVALYETGQTAAAKRELAQALPLIELTQDVAAYRTKIENAR